MRDVIVLGGTGYLGRPLVKQLCEDGFQVSIVVRPQSAAKIPRGVDVIPGDALDSRSYQDRVASDSTFVHLVGVPHPAPWKAEQFRSIDLVSLEQSIAVATRARVGHFVFVSVAQPAPVMNAFIEVRMKCEQTIRESGLNATILRPWYVLGPGHYWPCTLLPVYRALEAIPSTRQSAVRLGLVTRSQMVNALARAVASKTTGVRILETDGIRSAGAAYGNMVASV
jgi:uncharacterized protein YbjT (DUF2867 family)